MPTRMFDRFALPDINHAASCFGIHELATGLRPATGMVDIRQPVNKVWTFKYIYQSFIKQSNNNVPLSPSPFPSEFDLEPFNFLLTKTYLIPYLKLIFTLYKVGKEVNTGESTQFAVQKFYQRRRSVNCLSKGMR